MINGLNPSWFSSGGPFYEWHDFSYLDSAKPDRRTTISLFVILWIAVLDLCTPHTNFAVLYVVPLILLAQGGELRTAWRTTVPLVLLTYGIYLVKNTVIPAPDETFFDYRLINRTFVALMILSMGQLLKLWVRWRQEQLDAEISEDIRHQDEEISATFAVICSAPLVALIAVTDFFSPANFNLAILYPLPLFICGWTRSRPVLWGMLGALLVFTSVAFVFGAPPMDSADVSSLQRNRALAACGMIAVTLILHYWIGRGEKSAR